MVRFLILFVFVNLSAQAQSWEKMSVDELEAVWSNKTEHDTTRIVALRKYANRFAPSEPEYREACNLAYELSSKTKHSFYQAMALSLAAFNMSSDSSINAWSECAEIYNEIGETRHEGVMHQYIAHAIFRQGNYLDALYRYEKALKLYKSVDYTKGESQVLYGIAYIHQELGDFEKFITFMNLNVQQLKKIGDNQGVANFYRVISWSFLEREMMDSAKHYVQLSSTIYNELDDTSGIISVLLLESEINIELNQYEQSLNNIDRLIAHIPLHDTITLAAHRYMRAEPLIAMGRRDEALLDINWSINELEKRKRYGPLQAALFSLANINMGDGKRNQANQAIEKAIAMSYLSNSYTSGSASCLKAGVFYYDRDYHKLAIPYFKKSIENGRLANTYVYAFESWEYLFKSYQAVGDYENALNAHIKVVAWNDSLRNESSLKALMRQEYQYTYEKQAAADSVRNAEATKIKDAQLATERSENRKQKIILYFVIALVGVILFFVYMVVKSLRLLKVEKGKVDLAYSELEVKNHEILDSINYAKRIQSAILPPDKLVKEYLQSSFILYKPKDIVAGDFYWLEHRDNKILFAAADCTGHGVPGAMVSVICNNGLNRSVREYGLTDPGKILDKTREVVISEFEKSEEEVKDGMDIALCTLEGDQLCYAGAHNPLWIIRNGHEIIEEIKANKQPIGKYDNPTPYTTHTVKLLAGDTFYIFSDGFADQFGGEKGKKFKTKNFKELLLSIQTKTMMQQKEHIDKAFENWKGDIEQLDDVCVIGVRYEP